MAEPQGNISNYPKIIRTKVQAFLHDLLSQNTPNLNLGTNRFAKSPFVGERFRLLESGDGFELKPQK